MGGGGSGADSDSAVSELGTGAAPLQYELTFFSGGAIFFFFPICCRLAGLLFSGFLMPFWLPLVPDSLEAYQQDWALLGGAVAPGLAFALLAGFGACARNLVFAFCYALLGGFLVMGVVSGWVGGGDISITALTNVRNKSKPQKLLQRLVALSPL